MTVTKTPKAIQCQSSTSKAGPLGRAAEQSEKTTGTARARVAGNHSACPAIQQPAGQLFHPGVGRGTVNWSAAGQSRTAFHGRRTPSNRVKEVGHESLCLVRGRGGLVGRAGDCRGCAESTGKR